MKTQDFEVTFLMINGDRHTMMMRQGDEEEAGRHELARMVAQNSPWIVGEAPTSVHDVRTEHIACITGRTVERRWGRENPRPHGVTITGLPGDFNDPVYERVRRAVAEAAVVWLRYLEYADQASAEHDPQVKATWHRMAADMLDRFSPLYDAIPDGDNTVPGGPWFSFPWSPT